MSEITTKTVEISAAVLREEDAHLIEFYRTRNLVNAQGRFEMETANAALGQELAELKGRLESLLRSAEAGAAPEADEPLIVDPVNVEPEA